METNLLHDQNLTCRDNFVPLIPVGVSNRHVHLSQHDVEELFGKNHVLRPFRSLNQHGQFAAHECVNVAGPKGFLTNVRVLGPCRDVSQLEVSRADCLSIGISAPVRESGCLDNSASALLIGPAGHVMLNSQVICAWRHIHMSPKDAILLNVSDGQRVKVCSGGDRQLTFNEVIVRVHEDFQLELHIDTEEANAAGLKNGSLVTLAY
ncbi:phosphate propanoyltransferase [Trabulsiella guamensis]|uniref:phosphate propanoyltransferase n=1 Tax=Trabulsiella guamensis TaxID=158852 RepID=UPI000907D6BE|nr:phosphate propanoyltransferase [Trabulsiella guamensis]